MRKGTNKKREQDALTNFSSWLEKFMIDHKLQAKQISKASGIHPNVISNWRHARSVPNGYSIALLASSLAYLTEQSRKDILDNMVTAMLWA